MGDSFYRDLRLFGNSLTASTAAFAFAIAYKGYRSFWISSSVPLWLLVILGLVALWFVFDDWYGSRRIWLQLCFPRNIREFDRYPHQLFFIIDFAIALLAFPLVLSAFFASRLYIAFFVLSLVLGFLWAAVAYHNRYWVLNGAENRELLGDLSAVIAMHLLFAVLIGSYSFAYWMATKEAVDSDFGIAGGVGFSAVVALFVYVNRRLAPKWIRGVMRSLSADSATAKLPKET